MTLSNWNAIAFNPATDSPNQIHSDEMAKAYGFKGGLVPGVVISSYLMHPAVVGWGDNWIDHGHAEIKIHSPLYDGSAFDVEVSNQTTSTCDVRLIDSQGICCASGSLAIRPGQNAPLYKGEPLLQQDSRATTATPETMRHLKSEGMKALPIRWDKSHNMAYYLADPLLMPEIHQPDREGAAHGSFLLGITNWVLAENVYMNPWVHLETSSQFFGRVPYGTELIAECSIASLFEKKGHHFVDVGVKVFTEQTKKPVMAADLRAIYQMRAA